MQHNLDLEYKISVYNLLSPEEQAVINLLIIRFTPQKRSDIPRDVQSYMPVKCTQASIIGIVERLFNKGLLIVGPEGMEVDFDLKIFLFPKVATNKNYRGYIDNLHYYNRYYWNSTGPKAMREFLFKTFVADYKADSYIIENITKNPTQYYDYFSIMFVFPEYYPVFSIHLESSFHILRAIQHNCVNSFVLFDHIRQFYSHDISTKWLHNQSSIHLAEIDFFCGNIMQALERVVQLENHDAHLLKSQIALFRGDYAFSIKSFDQARSIDHYGYKKSKPPISSNHEFFYWLNYIFNTSNLPLNKVDALINKIRKAGSNGSEHLLALLFFLKKDLVEAERLIDVHPYTQPNLSTWMMLIVGFLLHGKLNKNQIAQAVAMAEFLASKNSWLLIPDLLYMIEESGSEAPANLIKASAEHPTVTPLLSRVVRKEIWEMQLEGLSQIVPTAAKGAEKIEKSARVCYLVNFDNETVQPILQSYNAKSGWTAGRNIALKKMMANMVDGMADQDLRIASTIKRYSSYYGSDDYEFFFSKTIVELCGHPLLFLFSNPSVSVELIKAEPEIYTEEVGGKIVLKTNIENTDQNLQLIKETQTRYKLVSLNGKQMEILRIINKGITIPKNGKEKLMSTVSKLSGLVTVHSHLSESNIAIKSIDADPKIRVQIVPMSDGLKAEIFVKPLGTEPPYLKPGKGGKVVYGTLDGEKCQALRQMEKEVAYSTTLNNALNQHIDADLIEDTVFFDNPYNCLELLETIALHSEIAVVEWPEGERFRIKKSVSFGQMHLSVKKAKQWFELDGELNIDENTVLAIADLLKKNQKSHGRFIELENGEFIALTEELKKQLNELEALVQVEKNKVTVNPFAAHALTDLSSKVGSFKTDAGWKEFQKRVKAAETVHAPIPATLNAELRAYQEEGFHWMVRLNAWGAGACLADDMGLGKTIQAIAMMLYLAEKGPALVVCPASVASNWSNELLKFAPTLNPILLKPGNRDQVFSALSPFDVLVISYGLLQSEEENIVKIDWAMAVLDEAHAIKNTQTKSSKAAMNIQAGFKLALTGTPVQNHLGEVWNLFQFCNPGLLGTLPRFTDRYVKTDIPSMRNHLKKLISPFILRRTKNNVLEELPPKTEITHGVELSSEEMAFYEALRREAIATIENNDGPNGQQHLQALAEITKLRLACCNTALVKGNIELPSSKLAAFFDIIDELRANKHRALVFSQFVGHLSIVRKALNEQGITYQYLDGSTSLPDRERAVKAFQTGSGELFLISLKAGGLGLNLTAADYVIHLDPWWNPAIEDQASDRAHRMGQLRPVTIYRLVAKNTIEEKIVQLHATKRDMADSLLEGSDQSARLSTNELLSILKDV
jgi:SNF2 family DNA or RNA helicase